jgi:hypothetical protein
MTYIRDDAADAAISKSETLQSVVHGRTVMLWLPGAWNGLAAQMLLMLGWASTSIGMLLLCPQSVYYFMYFMIAAFVIAGVTGSMFYGVVRGKLPARTLLYRFGLVQTLLAGCVTLLGVARTHEISLALGAGGVVLSLAATRLIAGMGFAIFAAIYRAQRALTLPRIMG